MNDNWRGVEDSVFALWASASPTGARNGAESLNVPCGVCREANLRYSLWQWEVMRGGLWVWCPACRRTMHYSVHPPVWWSNVPGFTIETAGDISRIDSHWETVAKHISDLVYIEPHLIGVDIYACRVCGLRQSEPPWGEDRETPTFDFCACCGVEFGYQDCFYEKMKRYRQEWLRNGATWAAPDNKPANWHLLEQLMQVGPDSESLSLAMRRFAESRRSI